MERIPGKCRQGICTKRNIFKTTWYYGKHCKMEFLKKKVFSYSRNSTVFLRSLQVGELKTYLLARFRLYWIAILLRHSFVWNNFFNFWGCVEDVKKLYHDLLAWFKNFATTLRLTATHNSRLIETHSTSRRNTWSSTIYGTIKRVQPTALLSYV